MTTIFKTGRAGLSAAILALALVAPQAQAQAQVQAETQARGSVTNLPLPRFVSLKSSEGNARRGPGLTHRIDWVFTRPGMPLRITAEHDNWRRVEDADGVGGWVHYALLSGVRSVIVAEDLADLHSKPDPRSEVLARAEAGVVARVLECRPDWCRVISDRTRGWVLKSALWGVGPDEVID